MRLIARDGTSLTLHPLRYQFPGGPVRTTAKR
jgi:hypothetical protein